MGTKFYFPHNSNFLCAQSVPQPDVVTGGTHHAGRIWPPQHKGCVLGQKEGGGGLTGLYVCTVEEMVSIKVNMYLVAFPR